MPALLPSISLVLCLIISMAFLMCGQRPLPVASIVVGVLLLLAFGCLIALNTLLAIEEEQPILYFAHSDCEAWSEQKVSTLRRFYAYVRFLGGHLRCTLHGFNVEHSWSGRLSYIGKTSCKAKQHESRKFTMETCLLSLRQSLEQLPMRRSLHYS